MTWRERVSVSIPCFGIRFSAVLYITNAPSIQMIQQLLGSPVVYQFYGMRFFVREASSPPPVLHNFLLEHNLLPQSTLIFWRKLCYTGGTVSYKKKLKFLYILSNKCPDGHKNLDYLYLLCKYSPDPLNFDVFVTSWMKNSIKMRKLKNWPKRWGEVYALSL